MKMTLGNFIAQLRKENNLTQKQLSEILGVSDKTVSHWEREESAPDISVLPFLAQTLGVTVDELLAGERKASQEIKSADTSSHEENSENDYYKFKQKNTAISLLSVVLGLSGTVVLCLLNYTFRFNSKSYYIVRIVSGVLIAFNMIAQGTLAIYAHMIYSGYINKHNGKNDRMNALRLVTFTYYPAFFFILAFIGSVDPISVWSDYGALIVFSAAAAAILILTEIILIKRGLIPKWNKKTFGKVMNSLFSLALAVALLTGSAIANLGYPYREVIYDIAECKEFYTVEEFTEYIETEVPEPEEKYNNQSFDSDIMHEMGSLCYVPTWGTLESGLFFNLNNKEVYNVRPTHGDVVPIKCYTHQALLDAEDEAEKKVLTARIGLFLLYPVSVAIPLSVYFVIKKKKGL